jgi:cytosine deaminase
MSEKELMEAPIAQARKSLSEGGIPIGSALARSCELLAVGHNKRVQESDPVTHAEIDCLRNAGRIGNFRAIRFSIRPSCPAISAPARWCSSVSPK